MNTNILGGKFAPQPTLSDTALLSNSQVILTANGPDIKLLTADTSTPVFQASLHQPPLCALDCGDTIILMTESAPRFLQRSAGQWRLLAMPITDPAVIFRAEPVATVQSATASIVSSRGTSLSAGLQPGSTLQRKISAALSEVYSSMIASSREGGYFLQPIIARCLFLDADGATVAISSPRLVGLPQLWQMTSPVSAAVTRRSDTDFTISPFTLSATPWTLHVDFPNLSDHPHFSRIASIKIIISEPIDFLDTKAQSPVRFSQTHGNSPGCTAAVPGATVALSSVTARFITQATHIARQPNAFIAAVLSPTTTTARISYPASFTPCAVPKPLRFSADCVTRSGSTVAWGNVHILPPLPPHPSELLLPGAEQMTVKIELFASSERIAELTIAATDVCRSPQPLLFTNHPEATEAKITFLDSSQSVTIPLIPNSFAL